MSVTVFYVGDERPRRLAEIIERERPLADLLVMDDAKWEESKHPRDKSGQFSETAKGGGGEEEEEELHEVGAPFANPELKGSESDPGGWKATTEAFGTVEKKEGSEPPISGGIYGGVYEEPGLVKTAPQPAAPAPKTTPVTTPVRKALLDRGFKKINSSKETAFVHPSGLKVIIHPIPGVIRSNRWSITPPNSGEEVKSQNTWQLKNLLDKLLKESPPTKVAQPQPPGGVHPQPAPSTSQKSGEEWLKSKGFKVTSESGNESFLSSEHSSIRYNHKTDEWAAGKNGQTGIKGKGFENLAAWIEENDKPAEPEKAAQAFPGAGASKLLEGDLGYADKGKVPGKKSTWLFTKGTSKVEFDFATGDWVIQTPPHVTKEGNGTDNLKALLAGKPVTVNPNGVKSWTNSSKTIAEPVDPASAAQAAAKAEAQKAAAEAQAKQHAWKVAKVEAEKKTMSKLIAAAPEIEDHEERAAIANYTGSGYKALNDMLRHQPDAAAESKSVKMIDKWLAKSSIPEDVVLYRGVSGEYAKIIKSVAGFAGSKFMDPGFMSTTPASDFAENWGSGLTMKINVKKGQKGAAVKQLSHHPNENEVLIARNSILVVKSFDRKKNYIEVDVDQSHF